MGRLWLSKAGYVFVFMKPDQWSKARKFAIVRELKPEEDKKQLSLLESSNYTPAMYVTNTRWELADIVKFYENVETAKTRSRKPSMIGTLTF